MIFEQRGLMETASQCRSFFLRAFREWYKRFISNMKASHDIVFCMLPVRALNWHWQHLGTALRVDFFGIGNIILWPTSWGFFWEPLSLWNFDSALYSSLLLAFYYRNENYYRPCRRPYSRWVLLVLDRYFPRVTRKKMLSNPLPLNEKNLRINMGQGGTAKRNASSGFLPIVRVTYANRRYFTDSLPCR